MSKTSSQIAEMVLSHELVVSAYREHLYRHLIATSAFLSFSVWLNISFGFGILALLVVVYWEFVLKSISIDPTIRWMNSWMDTRKGENIVRKIIDRLDNKEPH